jgi:hypothetical protein
VLRQGLAGRRGGVDIRAKLRNFFVELRPKADDPPPSLAMRIRNRISEVLSKHAALTNAVVMMAIGWPISILLSCSRSRWARGEL